MAIKGFSNIASIFRCHGAVIVKATIDKVVEGIVEEIIQGIVKATIGEVFDAIIEVIVREADSSDIGAILSVTIKKLNGSGIWNKSDAWSVVVQNG
jgi:hypothetical protein